MDNASFFIKDKALFGSFPTQEQVCVLQNNGVKYFIDLTSPDETKITPYATDCNYESFPITDMGVPRDRRKFSTFIYKLCYIISGLKGTDKIYVHCKGGHGRAGLVVACVTAKFFNISADLAIQHTSLCHSARKTMRSCWRRIGSPQTPEQKDFIRDICRTLIIRDGHILHPRSRHSDKSTYTSALIDTELMCIEVENCREGGTLIENARYNLHISNVLF